MSDLIDRQKAIKALADDMPQTYTTDGSHYADDDIFKAQEIYADCIQRLEDLPSAEPKITHCGDCRYKDDGIDEDGIPFLKCLNGRSYGGTRINDFCSWAERRTDA